uniref:Putative ovule protein n=1 Tax=Solanum chacoense TaxID=4108 RepID=A0A0V0I9U3_SOLCH
MLYIGMTAPVYSTLTLIISKSLFLYSGVGISGIRKVDKSSVSQQSGFALLGKNYNKQGHFIQLGTKRCSCVFLRNQTSKVRAPFFYI